MLPLGGGIRRSLVLSLIPCVDRRWLQRGERNAENRGVRRLSAESAVTPAPLRPQKEGGSGRDPRRTSLQAPATRAPADGWVAALTL